MEIEGLLRSVVHRVRQFNGISRALRFKPTKGFKRRIFKFKHVHIHAMTLPSGEVTVRVLDTNTGQWREGW